MFSLMMSYASAFRFWVFKEEKKVQKVPLNTCLMSQSHLIQTSGNVPDLGALCDVWRSGINQGRNLIQMGAARCLQRDRLGDPRISSGQSADIGQTSVGHR